MHDPADRPEPPAPGRPSRAAQRHRRPRFALPVEHHDERTDERIEAFLEGPVRARRSRPRHLRTDALLRPRRLVPLDTRVDWEASVRREDVRLSRYGRFATVLLVAVRHGHADPDERIARKVGRVIREHARATDRVTRMSTSRFAVLLPETLEADASALADRVRRTCAEWGTDGTGPSLRVTAAAVMPPRGGTLVDALRQAEARLDD